MHAHQARRAARITAAALGGVLAALAIPAGASATIYKAYDNGVLAYSTPSGNARTIYPDGTHGANVTTSVSPMGVAGTAGEWSADGNRLLLVDPNKNLLDVNPWTQAQVASVDVPFDIVRPSMSPDGTVYAFGSTNNGVSLYDTNGGTTTPLLGGASDGTAWSNEDQLVVSFDGNGVYRFDKPVENQGNQGNWAATDDPFYPLHVTVSRDGTKVAYTAFGTQEEGPSDDVFLAPGNGQTAPVRVEGNTDGSNDELATISPDGKKIAFVSDRAHDGTWSIYVRDLVANTTTLVPNTRTTPGTGFTGLSWQPAYKPYLAEGHITTAPEIGNTLVLDPMMDEPTMPFTTTWQWQRCTNVSGNTPYTYTGTCTDMPGETNAGFHLTAGDVGAQFRVVRTVTNAAGTDTDASLITEPAYTPDSTPPGVPTITTKPATRSNATSPAFAWTGAEGGGTFSCSIDGATFTACTTGSTFAVSGQGAHTFRVKQTDASNNVGDPALYTWTLDTVAPNPPTVTAQPAAITAATTAYFAFTGDEVNGSFECRVGADGATWTACSSPVDRTGLTEGDQRFSIRQLDEAGNASTPQVVTWTVDRTGPGAPTITTKPATRSSATAPAFAWTGAEAGGTYECSLDGAAFAACTSGATVAVSGDGAHAFRVRQVDAAGNPGTPAEHDWTLDTTGPATPAITTAPDARSKATAPAFAWTGAEAGGTYECSLDAAAFAACTSGSSVPVSGEGAHRFRVRQVDAAGNAGAAAEHNWILDTTGPGAPTITGRPATTTASQAATIAFTGAEAGGHFECGNGADPLTWQTCASPVSLTGRPEGVNRYSVRQVDAAGNAGTPKVVTWTVDLTAPVAPAITQGHDAVHAVTAQYAFTGEPDATFECQLDTAAWAPCASPVTLGDYTSGPHAFRVRQTDAAGHTGPAAEDAFDAYVDGPSSPVLGDGGPAPHSPDATATLAFTGTPDAVRFECRLDDGAWTACTSPATFDHLADGEHVVRVRGVDAYDIPGLAVTRTWTVDTNAPAPPTLSGVPAAQTTSHAIAVEVGGLEPGASVECDVDGHGWAPCDVPLRRDGFALGHHTLKVRQKDAAGNAGAAAAFEWTVVAEAAAKPATPSTTPGKQEAAKPKLAAVLGDKGTGTGTGSGTSSAAAITVRDDGVGVGCSITGTVLTACKVDLYALDTTGRASAAAAAAAKPVLVGTGTYRKAAGSEKLQVEVTLNATGRALMRRSPHGLKVSVRITGTPVKGEPLQATGVATLVRQRVRATVGGFAVNSATLTGAARRQLRTLARQVKGTAVAIRVVGHTDASSDDATYLKDLGLRRAKAVAAFLRAHGVKAKATLASRGSRVPKASNATAAGRAANRRVELRIDR